MITPFDPMVIFIFEFRKCATVIFNTHSFKFFSDDIHVFYFERNVLFR